jgi:hypothetical protein
MMRYRYPLFAFMFLAAPATLAQAQDSSADADLRCMAVMAKINQLPDARHRLESLIGGYYYLGRLNAHDPSADLGQSVANAFAAMSAADFLAETARCEKEMQAQGTVMSRIGGAMPKPPQPAPTK